MCLFSHGEWLFYMGTDLVVKKGSYRHGNMAGIWDFYIENGILNKKVEYSDKGAKNILDKHLLPPTPDQMAPAPISDGINNVTIENASENKK